MKKAYKKITLALIFGLLFSFNFTSCFNSVFYEIMQDVQSEEATVSGSITSITRYKVADNEYLVLAANNPSTSNYCLIRYKLADNNEYNGWKTIPADSLPFELHRYDYYQSQNHTGQQIIKIVADSENLYVVTAEYKNNEDEGTTCPSKIHLWQAKFTADAEKNLSVSKDDWTDLCKDTDYLPFYMYDSYCYSAFNVFCTNSTNPEHRFAYIRKGNADANDDDYKATSVYKLNGSSAPVLVSGAEPFDKDDAGRNNICSAVYYPNGTSNSDGVVFLNTLASITDETATTEPTRLYFTKGVYLHYTDKNAKTTKNSAANVGENIISMCLNKDSIIIGKGNLAATSTTTSMGGVERFTLDADGIPSEELGTFETNAKSQLLSTYFVMCLLSVDPSKNETDNSIYATLDFIGTGSSSTVSYKNVGLWSYYSKRGNWNRE